MKRAINRTIILLLMIIAAMVRCATECKAQTAKQNTGGAKTDKTTVVAARDIRGGDTPNNADPDTLTIDNQQIGEVSVAARLPLVEMTAGKTTYRLDASITQRTGSLYDVLAATPGVSISPTGDVRLNGKEGVMIMLDGKPTYMGGEDLVNMLKSTPATTAEKVEVITQPSARYEAAGVAGIIDIRSRQMRVQGMNASAHSNIVGGRAGNADLSASVNIRRGTTSIFSYGSFYRGKDAVDLDVVRQPKKHDVWEETAGSMPTSMIQNSLRKRWNSVTYGRAGFDHSSDPTSGRHNTWGASSWFWQRLQDENAHMNTRVWNNDTGFGAGKKAERDAENHVKSGYTTSHADNRDYSFAANIFGSHKMMVDEARTDENSEREYSEVGNSRNTTKKEVGELYLSADYFRYANRHDQWVNRMQADTLRSDIDGLNHIWVLQADADRRVGDHVKLMAGAKASRVKIDNTADYLRPMTYYANPEQKELGWVRDGELSSRYKYAETICALYAQAAYESGRLKTQAGLRWEWADTRGDFSGNTVQRDSSFRQTKGYLFPSMSLLYVFADNHRAQLSYSRRITRPKYGDLNPFTYVFDDYTHEGGNTHLRPAFTNACELSYLYSDRLQVTLAFTHTDKNIIKSFGREGWRIYIRPANLSDYLQTGVVVNLMNLRPASFWKMNLCGIAAYARYRWDEMGRTVTNARWMPQAGAWNQFEITDTWAAELNVGFRGPFVAGMGRMHSTTDINAAVRKQLFNKQMDVTLFCKDLLNQMIPEMDVDALGMEINSQECRNMRMVGVALSWHMKKGADAKEKRRTKEIDETKRIN